LSAQVGQLKESPEVVSKMLNAVPILLEGLATERMNLDPKDMVEATRQNAWSVLRVLDPKEEEEVMVGAWTVQDDRRDLEAR